MRKAINFLLACIIVLSTISSKIYASQEFQVHITVLCRDLAKGQEFINKLCQRKSKRNIGYPLICSFTDETNTEQNSTVIYDPVASTNTIDTYHVKFHLLKEVDKSVLKICSGAIILYDISDQTLDPIVNSNTFNSADLKDLTTVKTPLVKYINSSMFSLLLGMGRGWYSALSFSTYGKENLEPEIYKTRCLQINRFTCEAEGYYKKTDNQWNRGHADISTEESLAYTLYWICGQAYRSISSGSVSGKYDPSFKETHADNTRTSAIDNVGKVVVGSKDIDSQKKTA